MRAARELRAHPGEPDVAGSRSRSGRGRRGARGPRRRPTTTTTTARGGPRRGASSASTAPLPEDAPSSSAGAWRQDGVEFVPAPAAPRSARVGSRREPASSRRRQSAEYRNWGSTAMVSGGGGGIFKRNKQALRRERDRAAAAKRDDASSASESVSGGDSDDDDDDAAAAAVVPLDELHASALDAARADDAPEEPVPAEEPVEAPVAPEPVEAASAPPAGHETFAMRLARRTTSSTDLAAEEAPRDDGSRQWRLYTVYKAVMSDYAAVFSHHRALEGEGKSAAVYGGSAAALHFRVNSSRPEVFDIVTQVLTRRDGGLKGAWEELPNGLGLKTTWNLLWTWSRPRINYAHLGAGKESDMPNFKDGRCPLAHLLTWQKVNHYPHAKHLTRKDFLARSIGRCRHLAATGGGGKHAGFFDLCPETYLLPAEYSALVAAHVDKQKRGAKPTWIMKPVGLSRGRGISVVSSIEDVTYADPVVVQAYLDRPRLLGGHKFDLRLYVLVTSFAPLEAFLYREGFARVATKPFSAPGDDNGDKFVHLTNASIQKHGGQEKGELYGPLAGAGPDEAGGTKCSLDFLWRRLRREDPTFDEARVWDGVRELVLKSLVCVEDSIPHQPNSFELFGYDVLIDADSRCWLIEVNASPSMARASPTRTSRSGASATSSTSWTPCPTTATPWSTSSTSGSRPRRRASGSWRRRGGRPARTRPRPLTLTREAHLAGDLNALPGPRARVGEPRVPRRLRGPGAVEAARPRAA
ncbi:hypothetical protein JL720_843 [Aureococcus anophagefferens]|nr:hypothetical protein JL720_843 [Aureococcus anophagefferens]